MVVGTSPSGGEWWRTRLLNDGEEGRGEGIVAMWAEWKSGTVPVVAPSCPSNDSASVHFMVVREG